MPISIRMILHWLKPPTEASKNTPLNPLSTSCKQEETKPFTKKQCHDLLIITVCIPVSTPTTQHNMATTSPHMDKGWQRRHDFQRVIFSQPPTSTTQRSIHVRVEQRWGERLGAKWNKLEFPNETSCFRSNNKKVLETPKVTWCAWTWWPGGCYAYSHRSGQWNQPQLTKQKHTSTPVPGSANFYGKAYLIQSISHRIDVWYIYLH